MPSPLDRPPIAGDTLYTLSPPYTLSGLYTLSPPIHTIAGVDEKDFEKVIARPSSDDIPFAALAFKIMNDPFVGSLTFTRIYSGTLDAGSTVRNRY